MVDLRGVTGVEEHYRMPLRCGVKSVVADSVAVGGDTETAEVTVMSVVIAMQDGSGIPVSLYQLFETCR